MSTSFTDASVWKAADRHLDPQKGHQLPARVRNRACAPPGGSPFSAPRLARNGCGSVLSLPARPAGAAWCAGAAGADGDGSEGTPRSKRCGGARRTAEGKRGMKQYVAQQHVRRVTCKYTRTRAPDKGKYAYVTRRGESSRKGRKDTIRIPYQPAIYSINAPSVVPPT